MAGRGSEAATCLRDRLTETGIGEPRNIVAYLWTTVTAFGHRCWMVDRPVSAHSRSINTSSLGKAYWAIDSLRADRLSRISLRSGAAEPRSSDRVATYFWLNSVTVGRSKSAQEPV